MLHWEQTGPSSGIDMRLTKEQKAQQAIFDVSAVLLWYTAWLVSSETKISGVMDFNKAVNRFLKEDEDMVRRLLNLPQKGEVST